MKVSRLCVSAEIQKNLMIKPYFFWIYTVSKFNQSRLGPCNPSAVLSSTKLIFVKMHIFSYYFAVVFYPKNVNLKIQSSPTYQQLRNQKSWWSMKKCVLYCENTDFAKNAQLRLLILPFFCHKNSNFKKSFYLPLSPPANNSQTKNRDDPWRNAPSTVKTLILLKMHSFGY